MHIWQLFIILRHPFVISVTVFSNPTKLTNYLFKQTYLVGPTVTRLIQDPLAVLTLDNLKNKSEMQLNSK